MSNFISFFSKIKENSVYIKEEQLKKEKLKEKKINVPNWIFPSILALFFGIIINEDLKPGNTHDLIIPLGFLYMVAAYGIISTYLFLRTITNTFSLIIREKEENHLSELIKSESIPKVIKGKFWSAFIPVFQELSIFTVIFGGLNFITAGTKMMFFISILAYLGLAAFIAATAMVSLHASEKAKSAGKAWWLSLGTMLIVYIVQWIICPPISLILGMMLKNVPLIRSLPLFSWLSEVSPTGGFLDSLFGLPIVNSIYYILAAIIFYGFLKKKLSQYINNNSPSETM